MARFFGKAAAVFLIGLFALFSALPESRGESENSLILASTTSTENSGLLAYLLPLFKKETGLTVHVVAVGTGRAIHLAEGGDADVILVHDRASEEKFVAEGYGVKRYDVMYNDFIIIGPKNDPAGISGMSKVAKALQKIARSNAEGKTAPFISRGDDSGTHKAEQRLWAMSGINPQENSGSWYLETGTGMGATLNTAAGMGAYTLADRGTWLSFKNRENLTSLLEGDPQSRYRGCARAGRHPHVKADAVKSFIAWLTGRPGQSAIAAFKVDGKPLFWPSSPGLQP